MNKKNKSTLEELMSVEDREAVAADDKADAISLDEPKKRTWLVVLLVVLAMILVAGGGYVAWQSYQADKTLKSEEKIENPIVTDTEDKEAPKEEEKAIYTSAEYGLNMRKEPVADAEVLAVIPFGTKLVPLETNGDWVKVIYDGKTGWIAKLYTQEANPLVYKSTDYGFEMTFPSTWAYKFFKAEAQDGVTATYYVAIPTVDTSIDESALGVDTGYASLFALSVYTPSQWDAVQAAEGPKPTLGIKNTNYIIAYSLPNGISPEDLTERVKEVKSVLATLKF